MLSAEVVLVLRSFSIWRERLESIESSCYGSGLKIGSIPAKYSMAFTTGALLFQESVRVAELFVELRDWKAVRDHVITQNLLQAKTTSTSCICGYPV